jgi:hypothetical protein
MTKPKLVPELGRELTNSPLAGIVGDIVQYNVDLGGTVIVDGNAYMRAWKGTTDVSASVLSGNMTANGNIITLKVISGELAAEYRYTFRVSKDNQYLVFFFRRKVERESGAK